MVSKDLKRWKIAAHIVLFILMLKAALPFLLLIIASFTDENTALLNGYSFFPAKMSTAAYEYILSNSSVYFRAYGITILVTVIGLVVSIVITALTAYVLSKRDLPGVNLMNLFVIFTMLINGGLVATYINYVTVFNIKNTIWALIVPNLLMNAFNIMLVRNYFANNIPEDIYESARIDGASEMTIFVKMVLPLSTPILATTGLMTAIAYWNDWQNSLYYINDRSLYSIQAILNAINESVAMLKQLSTAMDTSNLPSTTMRMAVAVVGILPILIAYPFFQKYFADGLMMGAVKG